MYKIVLLFLSSVSSHTWMLSPQARLEDYCMPTFDSSTCCGDIPSDIDSLPVYTRGQIITTQWGRNNHIGGFIKYSIAPLDSSNDEDAFISFQYNCYASNCIGSDGTIFTGDTRGDILNSNPCSADIIIPDWLPDGAYTIQWRWHSGGDSYNIRNLGLIDFVSCHDFVISGEGSGMSEPPMCPLFVGGDEARPDLNACEFFRDNDIMTCTFDRDCYGWFAKAPPREIMMCPTNVINKNQPLSRNEPGERLYVGPSDTPHEKGAEGEFVDLLTLASQFQSRTCPV